MGIKPLKLETIHRVAIIIMSIIAFVLAAERLNELPTTNPASRFATVEALVHHGTFKINYSRFRGTIDKIKIGDDYYSSKPPVLSTLVAGVYWVYTHVTGNNFSNNMRGTVYDLIFLTMLIPHLILMFFYYKFLKIWVVRPHTPWALVVCYGFFVLNFLGLGYSTEFNNHSAGAVVLFLAFYYAFKIRHQYQSVKKAPARDWILCGLFSALLPTIELPGMFFSLGIFIYLMLLDQKRTWQMFVAAAISPLLFHFYLTYVATGSIIPSYLRPELYSWSQYWKVRPGIDGLDEPRPAYLFHMLFGHHGILIMTPILLFSFKPMVEMIKDKTSKYRREAILSLVLFSWLTLFYLVRTNNYGGVCVGLRWMIFVVPLLFVFSNIWIAKVVDERHWAKMAVLVIVFGIGLFNLHDTTMNPWKTGKVHKTFQRMGLSSVAPHNRNVPDFLKDRRDFKQRTPKIQ